MYLSKSDCKELSPLNYLSLFVKVLQEPHFMLFHDNHER